MKTRSTHRLVGYTLAAILLAGWSPSGDSAEVREASPPALSATELLDLSQYLASTRGTPDTYARIVKTVFNSPASLPIKITAYEENRSFIYAVAEMQARPPVAASNPKSQSICRWVRRVIVLSPSTFIIDDEFLTPRPAGMNSEDLLVSKAPKVSGQTARIDDATGEISAEIIVPSKATYHAYRRAEGQAGESFALQPSLGENGGSGRLVQILRVGDNSTAVGSAQSKVTTAAGLLELATTRGTKIYKLTLPPPTSGAGQISISDSNGKTLIATRPFPSGVLPHGPEGDRLLELWDSDYRHAEPAFWDIGRPAEELQKVVASGTVRQCRVVDMCCGSGTDAIYLAGKGFDVTALDVAPTALAHAMEKSRKASVSIKWMVADILAAPEVKPFDFIYDRGCYHVVRDQNLAAYTETLRRFSHPGTRFLLLASRRDDLVESGHSGVTEEELRFDFLSLFDLQWLREINLESNRPGVGPPGWSAFLIRNGAP